MKDLQALLNEANKKVIAKKRHKNAQSVDLLKAGSDPRSTSGPVQDLEGEDRPEEGVQEPAKRKRVETLLKEPTTPISVVPLRSESGDFLQLPKVWSEPDRCGPHSTLFLDDPELRVIHDLGPAGWSTAITEGVIATVKALEVATVLNNASLEGKIKVNALTKERDALVSQISQLEGDVADKRSVAEERGRQVAVVEKHLVDARAAFEQATESSQKLAEERAALEESLKKPDFLVEEETEDIVVLRRADLVERVSVLEGSLVNAVKLGFDHAVTQLKVVNPDVNLSVEGIHHLSTIEDGEIKPPPDFEEDIRHVDEA